MYCIVSSNTVDKSKGINCNTNIGYTTKYCSVFMIFGKPDLKYFLQLSDNRDILILQHFRINIQPRQCGFLERIITAS